MRRLIIALLPALAALALVGVAAAAPGNSPKAATIDVNCEGLGDLQVLTLENASVVAWASNGQHVTVKRFHGEFSGTVTTFDGNTYSQSDSFDDVLAKGNGFQDRLIRCTFGETFTETFPLDEQTAADFGIPSQYIGTEVTFNGTFGGTVWVMPTGK